MRRHLVAVAFALAAALALALAVPSVAQNPEARGISYNLSSMSNGDTMVSRTVFRASGPVLRVVRGVLLQSMAGFAQKDASGQWAKVPETQVVVLVTATGYCLKIGAAPCAPIPMAKSDVGAIRDFVASGRTEAITLATDAADYQGEVEKAATSIGMVKSPGIEHPEVWINKNFKGRREIQARLEILDFAPIFTSEVNATELAKYRASLNAALQSPPLGESKAIDASWIVSDLGANLVVSSENGTLKCSGYPTRAHWRVGADSSFARVWKIETLGFGAEDRKQIAADGETAEANKMVSDARWMVCTTAILRALHRLSPGSLHAIP